MKAQLENTALVLHWGGLNFRVRQHSIAAGRRIGCFHVPNGLPCEDFPKEKSVAILPSRECRLFYGESSALGVDIPIAPYWNTGSEPVYRTVAPVSWDDLVAVLGKHSPFKLPMANFFLTDANGQKHQINEQQLQALAAKGKITPNTPLEAEGGHKGLAGQIPGLKFPAAAAPSPFGQTVQAAPSAGGCFCTNCGNPVSAQAVACMSCGAKPVGHKKFCRHCGVSLNSEQVVCLKCRAPISNTDVSWTYDSPPKVPPPFLRYGLFPLSILCCLPVGFVAGIFIDLCNKDKKAGRYDAAVQKSNIAFIISIIGIVLGLFIGLCLLASS